MWPRDPIPLLQDWYALAKESEINDPNAMALATVDQRGYPSVRIVLLKEFSADGFLFFTNLESQKGVELARVPVAALVLHWKSLRRQVRVQGTVARLSRSKVETYFSSRPRERQLGAWASFQSREMEDPLELSRRLEEYRQRFGSGPIPTPPVWGGFSLSPEAIEFWLEDSARLHQRYLYRKTNHQWSGHFLFP